ncbi:MAG: response regulator transcription factor [Spirochaetia bacterium]|nr:response regulator transcription factor [Spirochaetia bacterium]
MNKIAKVSLVEDNNIVGERISKILSESEEFQFLSWYKDGETALAKIEDNAPDLIIVDLGLPKMNGLQAISYLKEKYSKIKIVVYTVFEDEEIILSAIQNGANGYLLKETSEELFLAELKVVMLGGAPMTPRIAARAMKEFKSYNRSVDVFLNYDKDVKLTDREKEVLTFISLGFKYEEISNELDISLHTVRRHIENIYRKLNVQNKTQALLRSNNLGLLDD